MFHSSFISLGHSSHPKPRKCFINVIVEKEEREGGRKRGRTQRKEGGEGKGCKGEEGRERERSKRHKAGRNAFRNVFI